jgi:aarF domain-containing kinase
VYEGVDRNSGRRVAIKIKHPNVNESVYRDVRILELVAYVFSKIPTMKWLSLYESACEFSVYMKSQLDLNTEASNLKSFRTLFQDVKDVQFPSVVEHDENVLIMDFVNGSCLSELMKSSGNEKLKRSIARLGLKSFLKMLLKDNMIHGDLHPGNIMYDEQGSITFLDVGLTVQLEREDRDNFLDLFRVVLRGQGREAGRLILERSKENNCEDPELFYDEMESIVNDALSQDGGLRDVRSCESLSL